MLARHLEPALTADECPHLAMLLRRQEELPPALASFYALGDKRSGWLVHRALPGAIEPEREAFTAAGLDVAELERDGRMVIAELDLSEPPEEYGRAWEPALDDALAGGFAALWYSRFAVGAEIADFETVLEYDRAWDACFRGRPVVTLCPFIVGDLDANATLDRIETLAQFHEPILVEGRGGLTAMSTGAPPEA